MGSLRLWIEPIDAAETTEELPKYWDELDEEEKKQWVNSRLQLFRSIHFRMNYKITEP